VALALAVAALEMVLPLFSRRLIDEVLPHGDRHLATVLIAGLLAFSVASALAGSVGGLVSLTVNARISNALRLSFLNHLQHLPMAFFQRHPVGEVQSRVAEVGQVLEDLSRTLQTVLVQGIYLLAVPPLLLWLDWRLALVGLASLPATAAVAGLSAGPLRRRWQQVSEAAADLGAFQVETFRQLRTLKAMGLEDRVARQAAGWLDAQLEAQLRAGRLTIGFGALHGLVAALATAIFTAFGWSRILSGDLSLGALVAFTAYLGILQGPVYQLLHLFSDFQHSAVLLSRMFEVLDEEPEQPPEIALEPRLWPPRPLQGAIRLRGVHFAYQADQPVFQGLEGEIPEGLSTAIVGASGCGKTTLLHLLARLESPTAGSLSVAGVPLSELPLADLRRQIAVVWQEVHLFRGTLWDNLTLDCRRPRRRQVEEVVELCGLADVVRRLPTGLETWVAEGGITLSAGQRQRLALARAVLKDAPWVLLDEATANLDAALELEVLSRVLRHLKGRTVLFVTHRLACAAVADRLAVLADGGLEDFGPPALVARRSRAYRALERLQSAAERGAPEGLELGRADLPLAAGFVA
jgi:ABC-type bacteriocin/lantibiotic exporter with double-glycine peptidase domain